jgi:hypothetical protein
MPVFWRSDEEYPCVGQQTYPLHFTVEWAHEKKVLSSPCVPGSNRLPDVESPRDCAGKRVQGRQDPGRENGGRDRPCVELQQSGLPAIAVKPELDKQTRMAVQAAKFESGQVLFPEQAGWLGSLEAELFAFPSGAHDDQIDSISQALAHKTGGYEWTDEALKGLAGFVEGLAFDQYLGRSAGRRW